MKTIQQQYEQVYLLSPSRGHWAIIGFSSILVEKYGMTIVAESEVHTLPNFCTIALPESFPGISSETREALVNLQANIIAFRVDNSFIGGVPSTAINVYFDECQRIKAEAVGADIENSFLYKPENILISKAPKQGVCIPLVSGDKSTLDDLIKLVISLRESDANEEITFVQVVREVKLNILEELTLKGLDKGIKYISDIPLLIEEVVKAKAVVLHNLCMQNQLEAFGIGIIAAESQTQIIYSGEHIPSTFAANSIFCSEGILEIAKVISKMLTFSAISCANMQAKSISELLNGYLDDKQAELTSVKNSNILENINSEEIKTATSTAFLKNLKSKGRVLFQNRETAFSHPGGDTIVMQRLQAGLEQSGYEVALQKEGQTSSNDFDIAHSFNFATAEITKKHAQECVANDTPYVVTSLYEDWPSFYNQMSQMYLALDSYVDAGQPISAWNELQTAAKVVTPSQKPDNRFTATHARAIFSTGGGETTSLYRDYPDLAPIIDMPFGCDLLNLNSKEYTDGSFSIHEKFGVKDYVLCVGRVELRKNQLMLLKALEDSDVAVVFADGGFSYQPEYLEVCKNFKRKGKTIFTGRLSVAELSVAYCEASAHVLPSWYELPGLVTLEAALFGTPVVVTDTGSTRSYVGEHASYCLPDDSNSIRNAINIAINQSQDARSALKTHVSQFTWERSVKRHIVMYEKILNNESLSKESSVLSNTKFPPEMQEITQTEPTLIELPLSAIVEVSDDALEVVNTDNTTSAVNICIEADILFKSGKLVEAKNKYREAIAADPHSFRAFRSIGAVALQEGNNEEAQEFFTQALRLNPKDCKSILGQGAVQWNRGKKERAFGMYEEAARLNPCDPSVMLYLVSSAYELGELDKLSNSLKAYLQQNPHDDNIQYCLAGCYFKQGKFTASRGVIERLLKLNPEHRDALELSNTLLKKELEVHISSESLKNSHSSLDLDYSSDIKSPKSQTELPILNSSSNEVIVRIRELKTTRQFESAVELADKTLGDSTLSSEVLDEIRVLKAEALGSLGEIEKAQSIFTDLVSRQVYLSRSLSGLGALEAFESNWGNASSLFEQAISADMSNDLAFAGLGICAQASGKLEDAWNYFTEALRNNPENIQALYGMVQLGYEFGRLDEVESILRGYLEMKPVDISILYSLAGCLYAQGRSEEAVRELKNILLFEPKHEPALELISEIHESSIQNSIK